MNVLDRRYLENAGGPKRIARMGRVPWKRQPKLKSRQRRRDKDQRRRQKRGGGRRG